MFQRFDEDAKKILKRAKIEMQELKHPFVGTEHLLLSILKLNDLKITKKLNEYEVTYDNFRQKLIEKMGIGNSLNSYFIYTPMLKRVIENAIIDTKDEGLNEVNANSLFISLLDEGEGVAIRILNNLGVNIDELYQEFMNKELDNMKYKNKKKLSVYDHAVDLCEKARLGKIDPVIGRDEEINRLIEILSRRNKNNPLLIGEAGVGKTAIVEALALKIVKKEVPSTLLDKKILSISMANLVAGTKYRGEFEERINKIIKEIEANPNLIIFIDEMHSLVGAGGAEGAIDASNIFKPSLARGKFKLIGATTIKEYKDTIEKDKALDRRFQTILVKEPNLEETKNILTKIKPIYESYHNVIVPDIIISDIVNLSNKYIYNRQNPDKSIDILDEVCAMTSLIKDKSTRKLEKLQKEYDDIHKQKNEFIVKHSFDKAVHLKELEKELETKINNLSLKSMKLNKKTITTKDVAKVIKDKTNIPVYEIDKSEYKSLQKLETNLNETIIGQQEAIKELCLETKRLKLGLKDNQRPTSFLFTGKTGVGKTELVKEYASLLNINLIRLDASEYKESHTTSKIIGSPPGYVGYDNHETVLDKVKNYPYSIILIDEIEKASTSVINLFLQILDEGYLTSSTMEKVSFRNTIIIMTSNITANTSSIGFNQDKKTNINNKLQDILSLELINRLDHVIQFNELTYENIKQIIEKTLTKVKTKFKENNISIKIDDKVIEEIIDLSEYKLYGARKVKKVIENKIDNLVIDSILNGVTKVNIHSLE